MRVCMDVCECTRLYWRCCQCGAAAGGCALAMAMARSSPRRRALRLSYVCILASNSGNWDLSTLGDSAGCGFALITVMVMKKMKMLRRCC